jgi:hypothetical protein
VERRRAVRTLLQHLGALLNHSVLRASSANLKHKRRTSLGLTRRSCQFILLQQCMPSKLTSPLVRTITSLATGVLAKEGKLGTLPSNRSHQGLISRLQHHAAIPWVSISCHLRAEPCPIVSKRCSLSFLM